MSTPPSARSTATRSRAPPTATPAGSATTRCWPPAPTPARCCTPASARAANTARGAPRFVDETIGRVRRAGATGEIDDPGRLGVLVGQAVLKACRAHHVRFSITVRQTKPVRAAIAAIDEDAWVDIATPTRGIAQVAETRYPDRRPADRAPRAPPRRPGRAVPHLGLPRLRHRPARQPGRAGRRPPPPRRRRARHPRPQAGRGLNHHPLRAVPANAAWLVLPPWPTTCCAGPPPSGRLPRRAGRRQDPAAHLLALPGRLTRTARRWTLHLPARWPWAHSFTMALARLRCIPDPGG